MKCFFTVVLTYAGIRTVHSAAGIWQVARSTLVTLWPCGVVHTILTHTSASPPTGLVHCQVKMTALGVVVALTSCGDMRLVQHTSTQCEVCINKCDKSYVCRYECFPPLQVSRADHCRDQHNAHSSHLLCCAGSHTEGSPEYKHRKKSFMKRCLT